MSKAHLSKVLVIFYITESWQKKKKLKFEVKGDLQLFIKAQHHEQNTVKMIINTR